MPYCSHCGQWVAERDDRCVHCGTVFRDSSSDWSGRGDYPGDQDVRANGHVKTDGSEKRDRVAGRRTLLKAFGAFGAMAILGVALFGDDRTGGSAAVGTTPEPAPPVASFTTDYDPGPDTVTLTHDGGDALRADELFVDGKDVAATGSWSDLGGSTSGSREGQPTVTSGDSLELGARPTYHVDLVWRSADGTATEVLASHDGSAAGADANSTV